MQVSVHEHNQLASAVAARILSLISTKLRKQPSFNLVLTGGTLGIETVRELGKADADFSRVNFYFGDERFVPLSDPERNEAQAIAAWPSLAALRLHRFPDSTISLDQASAKASSYFEAEFGSVADPDSVFDLVLLGMGPDGHVASLFPGRAHQVDWVVAEADSPKPPIQRLSLSYQALNRADRVWFLASGAAKAKAAKSAMIEDILPAGKVRGMSETIWFIDPEISAAL